MTNTSFSTYFSLLKFAYKRDSGLGKITHAAFFLTMLSGLIFAWKVPDFAATGYLLCLIAFAGLLIGYWLVFCIGFLLQNSPANACTVPHLHQRIRRLSLALGLLFALTYATTTSLFFGHFFIALAFSIASLTTLWAYNAYFYGVFFLTLFSLKYWLPFVMAHEHDPLFMITLMAISSSYAWLCLRSTFPQGGDRHQILFKSLGPLLRQMTPSDSANTTLQKFERLHRFFTLFYRYDLNAIITKKRTASSNKLLNMGFGPGMHWGMDIFMASMALIFSLQLVVSHDDQRASNSSLGFLLLFIPLLSSFSFAVTCKTELYKTRREQTLLCLVPNNINAPGRNRALRQILLRRYMQNWLLSALMIGLLLGTAWALGLRGHAAWLTSLVLSPLFFVYLLRDYSEMTQNAVNEMGIAGVALIIIIACFSIKLSDGASLYFSISGVGLVLLFGAHLGMKRWRRMQSYSFQLPVGHRKT